MIPEKYKFLFIKENIKFYTKEDHRLPTFYFENPMGFKGRIRQQHDDGAKISYQGGSCIRRFVKPENVEKIYLTKEQYRDNKIKIDFRNELFNKLTESAITEGYYVFEYLPQNSMCHLSGGIVGTNGATIDGFKLEEFIASNNYKFSADWGD